MYDSLFISLMRRKRPRESISKTPLAETGLSPVRTRIDSTPVFLKPTNWLTTVDDKRPKEVFRTEAVETIARIEISGAARILREGYGGEVEAGGYAAGACIFISGKELRYRIKIEIRAASKLGDD